MRFTDSSISPNPKEVDYWVDLSENPYGGCIKYYNGTEWVRLLDFGGDIDLSDYYKKTEVNTLLNSKADNNSVESKVDDTEAAKFIKKISFDTNEHNSIKLITATYDDSNIAITIPAVDDYHSGIITADQYKDILKQIDALALYAELYKITGDIKKLYLKKLKAGNNIVITEDNIISATGELSVYWEDIFAKPEFKTVATTGDYNDLTNKLKAGKDVNISEDNTITINIDSTELNTNLNNILDQLNTEIIRSTSEDENINTSLNLKSNKSDVYTKNQVDLKVSGTYKVKGSSIFEFLPTENTIGDVYNISTIFTLNGIEYPVGTNVVWTEDGWDALSGVFDTTTLEGDIQGVSDDLTNEITRATTAESNLNLNKVDKIEGKQLSTNDYTTVEKNKLNGIQIGAQVNVVTKVAGKVGDVILNKTDVGLSNVDNTSDVNKPISTAVQTVLNEKVNKQTNKDLSTNDFTNEYKIKLDGIATGADVNVNADWNATSGDALILNKPTSLPANGGNADTATKLQIPRTIWGLSFDGSTNVTGAATLGTGSTVNGSEILTKNNSNLIDLLSYGVEWDITVADPVCTRVGNPLLHKQLPIQSSYRGCVALGKNIKYYLNPSNWAYKEDGTTPSVLDGTDGEVMVHIPKFYGRSFINGNKRLVRISMTLLDGTWVEIPEMLVAAYRGTVDTTVSATPKMVSVVNTTAAYRGGGNRTEYDTFLSTDIFRTDLGKPRTNINRAAARTYATNNGSELLCYEYYKWVFYWNYVIEYANFNSQAQYNATLTSDGYKQGGLGDGVTTWNVDWDTYNSYFPITPNGYCNNIGNFTGIKDLIIPGTVVATKTFNVPRWRGFDNPFGDIWTNLDGVLLKRDTANAVSNVYTTSNSSLYGDDATAVTNMSLVGTEIPQDGYTKTFDIRNTAEIIPNQIGASSTTYKCDYHWCNAGSIEYRTLWVGGGTAHGGLAGIGCFYSDLGAGYALSHVGFRTLIKI